MSDVGMIYLLIGQCGDYEEKDWWVVSAFTDPSKASYHEFRANSEAEKIKASYEKRMAAAADDLERPCPRPGRNKFDRQMGDRTDARYHIQEVILR